MRSCLQTPSKVAKVKFLNEMACCSCLFSAFFIYGYYLTVIYFLMSRLFLKFLKFWKFNCPDKKNRGWNTSRPLFSNLLWFSFFIFLDDFRNFNFHLHTRPFFYFVICQNEVFLWLSTSQLSRSFKVEFAQPLSDNTLQWYPSSLCNSTSKYSLKSFSDMAPCTT